MKKIILSLGILTLALFQSCETTDDTTGIASQDEKVVLNTNSAELNARVDHSNAGVINLVSSNLTSKSLKKDEVDDFPMSLLAEMKPIVYNGKTLTATHVDVNGKYVYVSYNTTGETYLGGIDVINISEPNNPKLEIQAIFPNIDVNTVIYENENLYFSGAASVDANPGLSSPAFVARMPLNGGLLTKDYLSVSLQGYVSTGVVIVGNDCFAVSGNNGFLAKLDKSKQNIKASIPISDLRAIGYNDSKIVVLSGTEGVKVYNADTMALVSSFSTTKDVADSKRTIDFIDSNMLISEGYAGVKMYNAKGSLLQTLDLPKDIANVVASDVVTNAVSVSGDYVYAANGAAGIAVYQKGKSDLTSIGSIFLGGSSNYVKSVGDYIFVANGTGGLKIVKKLSEPTVSCTTYKAYDGGQWLNVNSGETLNYQGSASIQGINVNQNLTFCGSLSVHQGINVNSEGVFTMKGSMAQGKVNGNGNSPNFIINGTFKVEGSIVIYGDLILNSGATIEFLGSGSSITIYGKVTKDKKATIKGDYTDTFDKLK